MSSDDKNLHSWERIRVHPNNSSSRNARRVELDRYKIEIVYNRSNESIDKSMLKKHLVRYSW